MAGQGTTREEALAAFAPERFGLHRHHEGWLMEHEGHGHIAFAPLAWPHAQVRSFDDTGHQWEPTNALGLLVKLQQVTWGFPPEEAVPVNVLATLEDTGGGVLVAYDLERGFNSEGWLGFAIGFGTRHGTLYSHMLGVREEKRGALDLGWLLKVLQGYEALRTGHHAMTWTFDPMRGANARLNLEKLAATIPHLTIDKYGVMRSSLYGDVPTDRFTAHWDLHDPAVHARIAAVRDGQYHPLTPAQVDHLPETTPESVEALRAFRPPQVTYRIPGDIDHLNQHDPEAAVHWRQGMRVALGGLMTTRRANIDDGDVAEGPIAVGATRQAGEYIVTGFATGFDGHGERESRYVLENRGIVREEGAGE